MSTATEILPSIYLGNVSAALDYHFLRTQRIECIINCTTRVPFVRTTIQHRIPVLDDGSAIQINKLYESLPKAVQLLSHCKEKRIPVLVHCHAGRQRSVAVMAAFLIQTAKLTPKEAIRLIQSKRPVAASPKCNFALALNRYYRENCHSHRSESSESDDSSHVSHL